MIFKSNYLSTSTTKVEALHSMSSRKHILQNIRSVILNSALLAGT